MPKIVFVGRMVWLVVNTKKKRKNIEKKTVTGLKTETCSLITYIQTEIYLFINDSRLWALAPDRHTYRVITERSPFRAFGVTSLQPIIKEWSNYDNIAPRVE